MEEKKEDVIKNLKIINSLAGDLAKLVANARALRSGILAVNKKISLKEKELKAKDELRRQAEE